MLSVTPYLGIIVVIVSIFGLFFPKLGYVVPLVMLTLMLISPFKGRWFCGNLCPRGSFNDFFLGKISLKRKIPRYFRSFWIRIPIFVMLMGFMIFRLSKTDGLIDMIGMVFVTMCLITTAIAVVLGIATSPRGWCTFCPMGTIQRLLGGQRHMLKVSSNCTRCMECKSICPMELKPYACGGPDCIKCSRCIAKCPSCALHF